MSDMRAGWIALVCALLQAAPAAAQIYTWRDAEGVLVLSDRPKPGAEGATYAVTGTAALKATRPLPPSALSRAYDILIERHAAAQRLSPDLVRAVIQVESAFDSTAVSPKGAMGLMQLMPATAAEYGVTDPFEPGQNIAAGAAYLRRLLDRYDGRIELALAAYNAGPAAVERYGDVPPYRETRSYVKKVTGAAPAAAPGAIYKWMELVEGRPVYRYSNTPPASGPYEVIGRR